MQDTHSELRVDCSWCGEILRPGRGPEKDQISHSCCCPCKARYFGTLSDASHCQMQVINREHEDFADGRSGEKTSTCHIDTLECKVCKKVVNPEPEICNCGGRD